MYKNIPKKTISINMSSDSCLSGCNVLCTIEVQELQHTLSEQPCLKSLMGIEAHNQQHYSRVMHRDIIKGKIKNYQNSQKSSCIPTPLVARNA